MQSRENYGLARYLSEDELLAARSVCKSWRDIISRLQPAPYQNKKQFILGISGQFTIHIRQNLSHAWSNYQYVLNSRVMASAILYKLTDVQYHVLTRPRSEFRKQRAVNLRDGLIYVPPPRDRHCWAQNQVWVLAQIHKGRAFEVISNVSYRNFKRQQDETTICAFAKEAVTAMQAGYTCAISSQGNIRLVPPQYNAGLRVSLRSMRLDDSRMTKLYQELQLFSAVNRIEQNKVPRLLFGVCLFKYKENDRLVQATKEKQAAQGRFI